MKILFIALVTILYGCSTIHKRPASFEGFFLQENVPVGFISQRLVETLRPFVGIFKAGYETQLTADQVVEKKKLFCPDSKSRTLFSAYCQELLSGRCADGCKIRASSMCSGVRVDNYFITARHCVWKNMSDPKVLFTDGGNGDQIRTHSLQVTDMTFHKFPYDVAIFSIAGGPFLGTNISIRKSELKLGERVFGIGVPLLTVRSGRQKNHSYSITPNWFRISLGEIIDSNSKKMSFCEYTNKDDVTNIEAWSLAKNCNDYDYTSFSLSKDKKVPAREERDIFLTNSDMTWGMSGSPLFDSDGQLIGIGSNVLSNDPKVYNADKNAIYVKGRNLRLLLNNLRSKSSQRQ